jgi:hypothetical protein
MTGSSRSIPGMKTPHKAVFSNDQDWRDTVNFEIQIGVPAENMPQGPDDYGYVCFDQTDAGWEQAPSYRWIEISTRDIEPDFEGNRIVEFYDGIRDSAAADDTSMVIPLPFQFRFYGESYDSITVCVNGFVAVGNQVRMVSYQNCPLDLGFGAGMGMIAPFWDNLKFNWVYGSSVWYYYLEDEDIFIVEWYNVVPFSATDQILKFQVILRDPEAFPKYTGDGEILFQYAQVTEVVGNNNDIPYNSIGISSPDGKTGLSYRYRGTGPVTSIVPARRTVLLFTTLPDPHQATPPEQTAPLEWSLLSNYPNPFNSSTTIRYSLTRPGHAVLEVLNINGSRVATLRDRYQSIGNYAVNFKADGLPSGVYFYRLKTTGSISVGKMVLIR